MKKFIEKNRFLSFSLIALLLISTVLVIQKFDPFNLPTPSPFLYWVFFLLILFFALALLKSKLKEKKLFLSALLLPLPFSFLAVGTSESKAFTLILGLWMLEGGFLILGKLDKILPKEKREKREKTPFWLWATLTFTIIIHFFFGLCHLDKSSYVDEKLWTYGNEKRIEKYYPNFLERDWKNTRPSDKPGVTLAAISGISLLWTTPSDFYHNNSDMEALMRMLALMRLPVLIFTSLGIFLLFYFVKNLFGQKIAFLATIFVTFSPILLGISRLINPDALIWLFMPLTLLAYFSHLKTKRVSFLYWTGFFLGLSLLTKYISNLLIVFFVFQIFAEAVFWKKNKNDLFKFFRTKIIALSLILFTGMATFYLLFPGVWFEPDRLLLGTLWSQAFLPIWKIFVAFCLFWLVDHFLFQSKTFLWLTENLRKISSFLRPIPTIVFLFASCLVLIGMQFSQPLLDLELLVSAPKNNSAFSFFAIFLSGFYSLLFSISPLILAGTFWGIGKICLIKKRSFSSFVLWSVLIFFLLYYLGSSVSQVASTVRYQIALYPLIFILSAYGWCHFFSFIKKENWFKFFLLLTILSSLFTLFKIKPHYFSYSSPLLPQNYIVNPKDMGDGSYEAGAFLNTLPEAENLKIWSDRNGVCVVFKGYCESVTNVEGFSEKTKQYDYYVISRASEYRIVRLTQQRLAIIPSYPLRLDRLYQSKDFIFQINPGHRLANYIRIIPGEKVKVFDE